MLSFVSASSLAFGGNVAPRLSRSAVSMSAITPAKSCMKKMQAMHDEAIQERTRLRLLEETQAQEEAEAAEDQADEDELARLKHLVAYLEEATSSLGEKNDELSTQAQRMGNLVAQKQELERKVERLIREVDTDHSGFIDYSEFAVMMKS